MTKCVVISLMAIFLLTAISPARAQTTPEMPQIARLSPLTARSDAPMLAAVRQGLRDLGWVEGRNMAMESRYAEGKLDKLPELAAEIVRLKANVILTGATVGALAAKRATRTIPIVIVTTGDPVGSRLVDSLARPGGNVTGLTALGQELSGKRLQLLMETLPGLSRVAVLSNPANPDSGSSIKDVEAAAQALKMQVRVFEAREPTALDGAFRAMAGERMGALVVLTDAMLLTHRKNIVKFSERNRLPTIYPISEYIEAGGLMFYGASLIDMYRRSAVYVDKILRGAKPADLPVEQPTKFELVINLKTAKQIGLTVPPNILARADRVIK